MQLIETRPHPAFRAASATRLLGGVFVAISVVILVLVLGLSGRGAGDPVAIITGSVFYMVPGATLIALSARVRRGMRGSTIVTLVITLLLSAFLSFALVAQLIMLVRLHTQSSGRSMMPVFYIAPAVVALMDVVAVLAAVYCVKSLRFPDSLPQRGFSPVMANDNVPVATPIQTSSAERLPNATVNDH